MLRHPALLRLARIAARAGIAALVAAGALSCAQLGPASRPAPVVDRSSAAARAAAPLPVPPAPAALPAESPAPAITAPIAPRAEIETLPETAAGVAVPVQKSMRPADAATDLVALILPLEMPQYARAADAVRAGFLAAADAAGEKARCVVIGHSIDGVLAAFDEARRRGVRVVVGPLLRDDLKTLAIADAEIPWTIALNQLDDRAPLPPAIYSFALTVDADARVIAHRARADGARAVDVIVGDPPLMKRLAAAFSSAWTANGGAPPSDLRFDPAPESLTALRRNLARAVPDAVVLAVDGNQAALVKSFVGSLPAYASGLVFERPELAVVRDLNEVRVVEVPWLVTPDAPEFSNFPRPDLGSAALDRLYALGVDAFRVSQAFGNDPPERFELEGATGHISLNEERQFVREGRLAVYRDGRLVPLDAAPR